MSQTKRHAQNSRVNADKLDIIGMIRPLARLRGSALRGRSLGRAIVILALSMTVSFASANELQNPSEEEKPFNRYNTMNLKLYLHNQIKDWDQFECAVELGYRESSWRTDAVNRDSGAYGLFQSMSDYAKQWDGFEQIDKHVLYIDSRYDGSWCKALRHLKEQGWH